MLNKPVATTCPPGNTNCKGHYFLSKSDAKTIRKQAPNNPKAIEKAMDNATQEDLVKIKEAELKFEADMKKMEVDVFALETADKQDARKAFSKDWTARIIGIATIGGFLGYIFLVTLQPPEQNSEALINLVLGYLGGLASAIISFYFGASNTSNKDD